MVDLRAPHCIYRIMVGFGYLRSIDNADAGRVGAGHFNVVQDPNMWRLLQMLLVLRQVYVEVQEKEQNRQPKEREEMLSSKEPVRGSLRSDDSKGKTEVQEEIVVPKPENVWVLRMRPVNTEELLHGAEPLLFTVLHDQKVRVHLMLLWSGRR